MNTHIVGQFSGATPAAPSVRRGAGSVVAADPAAATRSLAQARPAEDAATPHLRRLPPRSGALAHAALIYNSAALPREAGALGTQVDTYA